VGVAIGVRLVVVAFVKSKPLMRVQALLVVVVVPLVPKVAAFVFKKSQDARI
jgi:hypothetical protein